MHRNYQEINYFSFRKHKDDFRFIIPKSLHSLQPNY